MTVLSHPVTVKRVQEQDYISLTDIARVQETYETDDVIRNRFRNRNTIEFLGIWEQLNNPGFNPVEFDGFRQQAGLNSFPLRPSNGSRRSRRSESSQNPAATVG